MVEDTELIRQYAEEQSEAAFAELVQRHVPLVYSAALRRLAGDAHAAADITQLVFTALARQSPSLRQCRVLPGWLYATTRNAAVDFVRSEHRRRKREQEAHVMHELDSTSPPPAWEQLRPMLDEAMDRLGTNDREAVLLRFFARRSFAEIGAALNVTEDAARMRVDRALEKLRVLLARRGATSTGAALGLMLAGQAATAAPAGIAGTVTSVALKSAAHPALGLIQFMSTSKTIATAGLALALTIGITVHEVRRANEAGAALETSRRDLARIGHQLEFDRQRAGRLEKDLAELQRSAEAARQAGTAQLTAEGKTAATSADPIGTGRKFLEAHPETSTLIMNYAGNRVTVLYRELFQRLGLSPAQIEQFRGLAAQLEAGIRWNSATQEPVAEINVGDLTRQQIEDQLRGLLGPAGYAQYEDYTRALRGGTRQVAAQIAQGDYFSASPLTTTEAGRLTDIVANNSPEFRNGQRVNLGTLDWENTLAQAGAVLSGSQLAALAALREKYEFEQAMRQATNLAIKDAKAAAGVPANY